jgi:hypothetical protein
MTPIWRVSLWDFRIPLMRSTGVRRRTLVLVVVVIAALGVAGGWLASRSAQGATGICASAPTGLRELYLPKSGLQEATMVFTNFRFGRMDYFYGLSSGTRWPSDGVTIAVSNEGPDATPPFRRFLRVTDRDFRGFEGMKWPAAHFAVRSGGRVLEAYAEVRTVTPAAIALVNHALADVRACLPPKQLPG